VGAAAAPRGRKFRADEEEEESEDLQNPDNSLVTIDRLWSLAFGNSGLAGPSTALFSPPDQTTRPTGCSGRGRRGGKRRKRRVDETSNQRSPAYLARKSRRTRGGMKG